jgi:hypothetical protein
MTDGPREEPLRKPGGFPVMIYLALFFGLAALVAILAGCSGGQARPELVPPPLIPVRVACVSGERPPAVAPLKERYTAEEWSRLTPKQKAAIIGAQGLRHQVFGEKLNAATIGCP